MHLAPHLAELLAHALGTPSWSIMRSGPRPRPPWPRERGAPHRADHSRERHRLPDLKEAGFTGYLVKPIRAASLAAQLTPGTRFEGPAAAEPDAESVAKGTQAEACKLRSSSPRTTRSTRCW